MGFYRIETETFEGGEFNVDAAYVIHLEGNGRLANVRRQLQRFPVCKNVHIVYNKGYEKTGKPLPVNAPAHDLVDAYKFVFRDAADQKYDQILVFEDDFFFRKKITSAQFADVNAFLEKYRENCWVYHLGCVPGLMIPVGLNSYWTVGFSTHACIYSKPFREQVLKHTDLIYDWDVFLLLHCFRFAYKDPLCYQIFPETQNFKTWTCMLGITYIIKTVILMFKLDQQPEPGYAWCYSIAKTMFYLIMIVGALVVWLLVHFRKTIVSLFKVIRKKNRSQPG